ncbi:unnamed protein product [Linum trigynum]|uniref:Retrotransposon gag domain-containing protein n=1 Tax=Linum trigynum TaxID=586398 RepID=A0AAV2GPI9_9ROSI
MLIWGQFVDELLRRFDNQEELNVVASFNHLRQTNSVSRYPEDFEDLRSHMLRLNPALNEQYFILIFLGGLDDEIHPCIQVLNPPTLACAFYQARLEEAAIEACKRKTHKTSSYRWSVAASPVSTKASPSPPSFPSTDRPSVHRGQSLSYKYGDKYFHGHICAGKKKQQVMHAEESPSPNEAEDGEEDFHDAELEVSLQPMGSEFRVIHLILAIARHKEVTILIDT